MKMNKILLDLNEYNLSEDDFAFLTHKCFKEDLSVNGYMLKWYYNIHNGVVEITAELVKR